MESSIYPRILIFFQSQLGLRESEQHRSCSSPHLLTHSQEGTTPGRVSLPGTSQLSCWEPLWSSPRSWAHTPHSAEPPKPRCCPGVTRPDTPTSRSPGSVNTTVERARSLKKTIIVQVKHDCHKCRRTTHGLLWNFSYAA